MHAIAVIETTREFQCGLFEVRLWIDHSDEPLRDFYDTDENLVYEISSWPHGSTVRELALRIAEQPRVNAVQVRDKVTGRGVALYPNWP